MKSQANSLTAAIIRFIVLSGGHAERVNNIARKVINSAGVECYAKSTNFKGTADIHAVKRINLPDRVKLGQFVAIEVKVGRDVQSQDQADYADSVVKAGGVYFIARTFDDFEKQWNEI